MDLLDEIRFGFANLDECGRMLSLQTLPPTSEAWAFREDTMFGVAVEIAEHHNITEHFSGAKLATVIRNFDGKRRHLLRLESSIQSLRNEFAVVCAQMVAPGIRGELMNDPLGWWEKWRHLLGNAMVSRTSYATLGELLALERLMKTEEQVEWRGPAGGSIDLVTPSAGYEVKSTISRYDSRVHIAGQFQLALSTSKTLNLVHYRLEPSSVGESVNSVCSRLIESGFDVEKLESLLMRCGLEAGCSARAEKFNVLDSRVFPVDDAFPRITRNSFLGGKLPPGVVHIEYQIDLTGLTCEPF